MVSFAADALKRLVICNRIIRPTSGTIDRSISSPLPPPRCRPSPPRPSVYRLPRHRSVSMGMPGIEKPTRTVCETAPAQDYICPRKIGFLSRNLGNPTPRRVALPASVSPRALFIRAHIRTYKIFREFFSGNPREARCDRASIEDWGMVEAADKGATGGSKKIIAGYQSRDQRAVLATFSDCYYPTGHFIALKRTAILLLRSLSRIKSFPRRKDREREKQRERERALRVSRELVEYHAWLSGKEYGWFIEVRHMIRYYSIANNLLMSDFIFA